MNLSTIIVQFPDYWITRFLFFSAIVGPLIGGTTFFLVITIYKYSQNSIIPNIKSGDFAFPLLFFSYIFGIGPVILNALLLGLVARPPAIFSKRLLISPFSGAFSTAVVFLFVAGIMGLLAETAQPHRPERGIINFLLAAMISGSAASLSCTALMERYQARIAKRP